MLSKEARETLEIFIEKASFLDECIRKYGSHMVWISSRTDEDEWKTHTTLQMLLPAFCMFIQSKDGIALYIIDLNAHGKNKETILNSPSVSDLPDLWFEEIKQAQKSIASLLECPALFAHNGEPIIHNDEPVVYNGKTVIDKGETLTYRRVFEIYFYGNEVHCNRDKRMVVKYWKSNQNLFQAILHAYIAVLVCIIEQVYKVAEACIAVLGNGSSSLEKDPSYHHPAWSAYLDMKGKGTL